MLDFSGKSLYRNPVCSGFAFFILFLSVGTASSSEPSKVYDFTAHYLFERPQEPFEKLRIWVPLPPETKHQKILREKFRGLNLKVTIESKYANRIGFAELNSQTSFPVRLVISWRVLRSRAVAEHEDRTPPSNPSLYLSMDKKVPINGIIADEARRAVTERQSPGEKIRSLYFYVVKKMTYDKSGEGWGQGDALWACSTKRGNCTDFHSLLVGMARSQKIPAQFNIGFPIPQKGEGEVSSYHCWAQLYESKFGWVPLDASESHKEKTPWKYFGDLPPNRIHFTTGRDLILNPAQNGEPLNYFIYPHLELDGENYSAYKKQFYVKSVSSKGRSISGI